MKETNNLSLSMELGDVNKSAQMMNFGKEFQRVITLNNNLLLFILMLLRERISKTLLPLVQIHSLEHLASLRLLIKLNLFQDIMETLISNKNQTDKISENQLELI